MEYKKRKQRKLKKKNVKNAVSSVHPFCGLRRKKIYQLVPPLEYFRISNFFILPQSLLFLPPEPELKASKRVKRRARKRMWCHPGHTYVHVLSPSLTRIFFSAVLLCSFHLDETELPRDNKWNKNTVTESTLPQKRRDWVQFVVEIRESWQYRTSRPIWSLYAASHTTCSSPITSGLVYCYLRLWWQTRDKLLYW